MATTIEKYQIAISSWGEEKVTQVTSLLLSRLGDGWSVKSEKGYYLALAKERYQYLSPDDALARLERDAKETPSIEDGYHRALSMVAQNEELFIADARLACLLVPDGMKVFITSSQESRIMHRSIRDGLGHTIALNATRIAEAKVLARYHAKYKVGALDTQSAFHLTLDADVLSAEDMCDRIIAKFYQLTV